MVLRRDAHIALVGFGWDTADEDKAQASFGIGRQDFGQFFDVQMISTSVTGQRFGLQHLSRMAGCKLPKPYKVCCCSMYLRAVNQAMWSMPTYCMQVSSLYLS